ncbi:MAG: hypothetical protein WC356_06950, partial [Candidatus Micrarchaeia archaeon]
LIYTLPNADTASGEVWLAEVWCGDGTSNTSKENSTERTITTTQQQDSSSGSEKKDLIFNLDKEINCISNESANITITAKRGKIKLEDMLVKIEKEGSFVDSSRTNIDGKTFFILSNGEYDIISRGKDYVDYSSDLIINCDIEIDQEEEIEEEMNEDIIEEEQLIDCETDEQCMDDERCINYTCVNILIGNCGYIKEHQWESYDCCDDYDCSTDLICFNHNCIKPQSKEEVERKNKKNAVILINNLKEAIELAKEQGKNTTKAEFIFIQINAQFEAGNYDLLEVLYEQAEYIINTAPQSTIETVDDEMLPKASAINILFILVCFGLVALGSIIFYITYLKPKK